MDTSEPTKPLENERTSNDKGKAKQLPGDTQPRDAFIVVMGPTGSGKSTFVNLCSGADWVVGHGLISETPLVTEVSFEHNGVNIHLVDTPGFDDTERSDTEVLTMIASYVSKLYDSKIKIDGFVYVSPITQTKMSGSAVKNLNMFSVLVGDEASSEVVLVTSMWNMVGDWNIAEDREKTLLERFWKPLIDKGSRVCRLDHRRLGALQVLDVLLQRGETHGKVLQIQRELVDEKKALDKTEAGRQLSEENRKLITTRNMNTDFSDTNKSPPPAYTQSTISSETSGIVGRQTQSRKAPSNINDEATKSDKFRSYFARNQNQRPQPWPENALGSNLRAAIFHQTRPNLRVVDEERRNLRAQLYQNSLYSFEQGTDSEKASNPILQRGSTHVREVDALCKEYQFSVSDQQELQYLLTHTLTTMSNDTLTSGAWLFYQSYLLRNGMLAVYHNCRRLQTARIAGPWLSMLVLESPSNNRTEIINLSRFNIGDIRKVVERLSSFVTALQDALSKHPVGHLLVSRLALLSDTVHLLYRNIFERLGLKDFFTRGLDLHGLATKLQSILNSGSSGELAYFVDIFAQWWCAARALDVGLVAYERGHVSSFEQTSSINLSFKLPQLGAFKLQDNSQGSERSRSLQYIRRGLNCLAGFFQEHDVWVLSMEEARNDLYLAADIETFADVWGPVWKVTDQSRPELIAKYNVRGGSIIPWPSVPDIHPELRPNERLCHWKSNANYIHHYGEDLANNDSSTSSSDSSETEEDSVQATSFSGDEVLVIGAGQDARLQWYDCHCSLNAIRQGLENAGRLDRIIASKSYRYIDSQQRSLVGGSHGVQTGIGWTVKDKSQESLKVRLLDRWENEPDLRDPREFENIWGVAVSLCTMNAQRVRLVELFGEESVMTLLRHFPWSGLGADGSRSYQRRRFLEAIRSPDPFALGNLWEDHPRWRTSIGNAIMICLRILFKTGYNENRNEFHMLWLPPGCRDPRRVTLKSSDQGWTDFLRDTTYSITVAIIIEDSLGVGPCSGNRRRWFKHPSILETAICVNTDISPAAKLTKTQGTRDEDYYRMRRDGLVWRSIWDVSCIKPGDRFWMRSQNRVITLQPLNNWHLLLKLDTVKREKFQALIGLKPTEHWKGHWEYTDVELAGDGVRPIPVHITS